MRIGLLVISLFSTAILLASSARMQAQERPSPAALATTAPYVLQAGDEIEIKAYQVTDLDAVTRIRPDGQVSLILLDDVTAAGLTPSALDAVLTAAYAK